MSAVYVADNTTDDAPIVYGTECDHSYATYDEWSGIERWHMGRCDCLLIPVGITTYVKRPTTTTTDLDDLPF